MIIEEVIIGYLSDALDVPVYAERPPLKDGSFVIVSKIGSSELNKVTDATVAIQSYAPTLYDSATLNEHVKGAMGNIANATEISRAKLNSDYNYTNTNTNEYRYQAVFTITY